MFFVASFNICLTLCWFCDCGIEIYLLFLCMLSLFCDFRLFRSLFWLYFFGVVVLVNFLLVVVGLCFWVLCLLTFFWVCLVFWCVVLGVCWFCCVFWWFWCVFIFLCCCCCCTFGSVCSSLLFLLCLCVLFAVCLFVLGTCLFFWFFGLSLCFFVCFVGFLCVVGWVCGFRFCFCWVLGVCVFVVSFFVCFVCFLIFLSFVFIMGCVLLVALISSRYKGLMVCVCLPSDLFLVILCYWVCFCHFFVSVVPLCRGFICFVSLFAWVLFFWGCGCVCF